MRAIIVDDEMFCGEYLEGMLAGIRDVEVAGIFQDVGKALFFMKDEEVNLVFLDIEMPKINGIEAARRMREINPSVCIIFVTGYDQYAMDAFKEDAVSYLLKPCGEEELRRAVDRARRLVSSPPPRIYVHTFGYFGLFIDEKPYRFTNSKAKELLALMVDFKGSQVTMEQAVDTLWEDRPYDDAVKQLYRKAVAYLRQITKECGVDFIDIGRGYLNINPTKIVCDFYQLLEGDENARKQYAAGGYRYMNEYSWAEDTLAGISEILPKKS